MLRNQDRLSNFSTIENNPITPQSINRNLSQLSRTSSNFKLSDQRTSLAGSLTMTPFRQSINLNVKSSQRRIGTWRGKKMESPQAFLKELYLQKVADLRTHKNQKQQQKFISKLADRISQRQFKTISSDFGPNCMLKICPFLLTAGITSLTLDLNPLSDVGVITLCDVLPLSQLQELSLVSVSMTWKGAKQLIASLTGLEKIKKINLSSLEGVKRNKIGKEGFIGLKDLLGHQLCKIQCINFSNTNIGAQALHYLCDGLRLNHSLKQIILQQSSLTPRTLSSFLHSISHIPLNKLDISHNHLMSSGLKMISNLLGGEFDRNQISRRLKCLNVGMSLIQSLGIEAFAWKMGRNQVLEEVVFDGNPLSQGEKFFQFKYFISRNWAIKKMSMKGCSLSTDDIRLLFEGLESNRLLRILDLSNNSINLDSFIALMSLLSKNKSLRTLALVHCNIADSYLIKAESMFAGAKWIEQIDLQDNFVAEKGGRIIKEWAASQNRLRSIQLRRNCVGQNILNQIESCFKEKNLKQDEQQPDLAYYSYLQQNQKDQINNLTSSIQALQTTHDKLYYNSLLQKVAELAVKEGEKQEIIAGQKKQINRLQERLTGKGWSITQLDNC